jgi:hypothetical protein
VPGATSTRSPFTAASIAPWIVATSVGTRIVFACAANVAVARQNAANAAACARCPAPVCFLIAPPFVVCLIGEPI